MPFLPYNYNLGPSGPVDWVSLVVFLAALLVIIGCAAGISVWANHHQGGQHRHGHQH